MRKKSHWLLSKYLTERLGEEKLYIYRRTFYTGSILPDCVPAFLVRRHNIEGTFDILKNEIKKLVERYNCIDDIDAYFCRHLGIITHYIADYFTFPHNEIYEGTMREHCAYEEMLKIELRRYVRYITIKGERYPKVRCESADEICEFIKNTHDSYLMKEKSIDNDIMNIVRVCYEVVENIFRLVKGTE